MSSENKFEVVFCIILVLFAGPALWAGAHGASAGTICELIIGLILFLLGGMMTGRYIYDEFITKTPYDHDYVPFVGCFCFIGSVCVLVGGIALLYDVWTHLKF